MAEQVVDLAPGESKLLSFEAVPHEAKTYQVQVDGLSGSFRAIAPPEPSAYLKELQASLAEAIEKCRTNPELWTMVPVHGIQYVCDAVPLFKELMVEEAISIGMITSSADAYFVGAVMYFTDGTTIVPYWWPCPYCPEKFRSPELLESHKLEHREYYLKGTITKIHRYEGDGEEPDIVGIEVTWRNDSPFSIESRIDVRAYLITGIWKYVGSKDVTLMPAESTSAYFSWREQANFVLYIRAKLYAEGIHLDTLEG